MLSGLSSITSSVPECIPQIVESKLFESMLSVIETMQDFDVVIEAFNTIYNCILKKDKEVTEKMVHKGVVKTLNKLLAKGNINIS